MDLPKHWRGLPTSTLDEYLTVHGDKLTDTDANDLIQELDDRDARAERAARQMTNDILAIHDKPIFGDRPPR